MSDFFLSHFRFLCCFVSMLFATVAIYCCHFSLHFFFRCLLSVRHKAILNRNECIWVFSVLFCVYERKTFHPKKVLFCVLFFFIFLSHISSSSIFSIFSFKRREANIQLKIAKDETNKNKKPQKKRESFLLFIVLFDRYCLLEIVMCTWW